MICPLCNEGTLISQDGNLKVEGWERFICNHCNDKMVIVRDACTADPDETYAKAPHEA